MLNLSMLLVFCGLDALVGGARWLDVETEVGVLGPERV